MIAKTLILSAAAVLTLPFGCGADPATAAAAQTGTAWDRRMRFELSRVEDRADRVQLSLRHGNGRNQSHYGQRFMLSELEGVGSIAALDSDGAPLAFRIVREAGIVECSGTARGGRGTGDCRFTPDAAFTAELERRGIGRPDANEQFHLAMSGVGRPLLAELERQDYPRPRISDLVALGIHGATVDYLSALDGAGYRLRSLDGLVAFRIHGVTPDYIRELAQAGGRLRNLDGDQLVAMRIHGVTPAYARAMAAEGYSDLAPQQLVNMRIHGVRPEDARSINAAVAGRH